MTSTVIVVAMAVVFALIVVILLGLMRQSGSAAGTPSAARLHDYSGIDLQDRLSRITLPSAQSALGAGASPPATDGAPAGSRLGTAAQPAGWPPSAQGPARVDGLPAIPTAPREEKSQFAVGDIASARPGQIASQGATTTGGLPAKPVERLDSPKPSGAFGFGALGGRMDSDPTSTGGRSGLPSLPPSARLALPGLAEAEAHATGVPPGSAFGQDSQYAQSPGRDAGSLPPAHAALPSPQNEKPGLPGTVARDSALDRAQPEAPARPAVRLGLPGTVAGGFTMPTVPSQPAADQGMPAARSAAPVQSSVEASGAQALDIRAILRGESVPRGLPGTVADYSVTGSNPRPKPQFTTGPLPPAPQQSGPLGAVPFDAGMLKVVDPRVYRGEAAAPSGSVPPVTDGRGSVPPMYPGTIGRVPADRMASDLDATRLVEDFDLPDTGFETHVFSTTELIDGDFQLNLATDGMASSLPLDLVGGDTTERLPEPPFDDRQGPTASHGVRAFDAPTWPQDAAQAPTSSPAAAGGQPVPDLALTEAEAMASALESMPGDTETIVLGSETEIAPGALDDGPASSPWPAMHISPLQETRAHDLMRDLAGSSDVVFVRLVAPQGTALAAQGAENGDLTLDACIAGAMQAARDEAGQQEFGEPIYLAVESDKAALLVAPVHEGAVLAIYVSNPARLGLLRRQVRKPVLGLRSLLMESRVS